MTVTSRLPVRTTMVAIPVTAHQDSLVVDLGATAVRIFMYEYIYPLFALSSSSQRIL